MRDAALESVAVGFFDGVHRGHQAILHGAKAAITFRNHPLSVLDPARAPRLIMSFADRLAAITACGVERIDVLDFDRDLAQEPPDMFLRRLGPCVRCGENWRFGAGGTGDARFLLGRGVAVEIVPYAEYRGERISSTRIRRALESGDMVDAAAMLGRPFVVWGNVFCGKGEGARLGFPTVNLHLETDLRLPYGAYAVRGDGVLGVANFGVAPTMGDRAWPEPCLELHFLRAFSLPPTQRIAVEFLDFLRPERRFESSASLAEQIGADIEKVVSQWA